MTTARDAILAAWQPLLERQHVAVRMILERHAEELARLAVAVICPTEGERMAPRYEVGAPAERPRKSSRKCPGCGMTAFWFEADCHHCGERVPVSRGQFDSELRNAQRDFA